MEDDKALTRLTLVLGLGVFCMASPILSEVFGMVVSMTGR